MELRCPNNRDWESFYALAAAEGWRVPEIERSMFKGRWQEQAMVLGNAGLFCGLVTAVAHERSGWIGNLIVPPTLRGRGYGRQLFRAAITSLLQQDVASIWLTASAQGQPLYTKEGFVVVDQVERWLAPSRLSAVADPEVYCPAGEVILDMDRSAWGENRQLLIDMLAQGSQAFACNDSAALLQSGPDLQIIGPWYSADLCPRSNRRLLQTILSAANPAAEIVIDLLASSPLRQLLAGAMFEPVGQTALMARGDRSGVNLPAMVSLASLGSVG